MRIVATAAALAFVELVLPAWVRATTPKPAPTAAAPLPAAAFVGAAVCGECHAGELQRWRGSHHDQAMQPATARTVRGNFDGATFSYAGVTSSFFKRDGKFFVRTDGPDGGLRAYEVAYTFGVFPLQQYLIAFPGGRLQALGIAWDTRPAAAGGQRWFHLYPGEAVTHGDVLHWTKASQNWNAMCADCHSTDLRRSYRVEDDRYETRWNEVNVSCEACHGPAAPHVEWAKAGASSRDASRGLLVRLGAEAAARWAFDPSAVIARRRGPPASAAEVETCAPCHARRGVIRDPPRSDAPFLDSYRPALLDADLYEADGQIRDEVYEYGSFLQSRMFHAGVTCSDCHDPHALSLKAEGNALCGQCHAPDAFDTPSHHHHTRGSAGARCVECHMPAKVFMVIDQRRDHSFRVPRPDLGVKLAAPNTCTACHADRSAAWAAQAIAGWPGSGHWRRPHYGEALAAGRGGAADAAEQLTRVIDDAAQPGIARATAVSLLGPYLRPATLPALQRALRANEPLVRMGALEAALALEPAARRDLVLPLLGDPLRAVRIAAARALAAVPPPLLSATQRALIDGGLDELRAAYGTQADRAESHLNLGVLAMERGDLAAAEREGRLALRLGPQFVPGYVNLADLYRAQGREPEGEGLLRQALAIAPESAATHHALGLLLVRQQRRAEALAELQRAVDLEPDAARYAYVLGIGLHSAGRGEQALAVLRRAHDHRPADRDLLIALATISRDSGARSAAQRYAEKLVALDPTDEAARRLRAAMSD